MPDTAATRRSVPTRHVAAVVVGNALEFYDFLTYSFFAVYIGRAFFPSTSPTASLLASLATFGVGFVTRPIGSAVIGRMGDRRGRKPAMVFSFTLMGVAITGLALTPSHSMIGAAAPVLAVFFRMLQGFALGGEVGPTNAFLLEAAPLNRRGFYIAFQGWSQHLSTLFSGLVGFTLANVLNERQLQDYGWRIAFLIGAAIVPFGLIMRRRLPETYQAPETGQREPIALRPYLPIAVLGLMMLLSGTIGTYVMGYMTTYAIATLHMQANVAFAATIVLGLCGLAFGLVTGALSDRVGRKPTMIVPAVVLFMTIFPAFYVISRYRTVPTLLGATAVLASLLALCIGPVHAWLTESLPASIRASGVAVIYAVSISTFGGTTQYAVTWIIRKTGNPLAPAYYWTVALIIGITAMSLARESAPCKAAKPEPLLVSLPDTVADEAS